VGELTSDSVEVLSANNNHLSLFGFVDVRFVRSLDTLRQFFAHMEPAVKDLDATIMKEEVDKIAAQLETLAQQGDEGKTKADIVQRLLRDTFAAAREQSHGRLKPQGLEEYQNDPEITGTFSFAMDVLTSRGHVHRDMLNGSIIMALVGYTEVMLSGLMTTFFKVTPDALVTEEKVLSIQELRESGSVEDALEHVINRRVDGMISGGLDDWVKFFDKNFKLSLAQAIPCWSSWCEVFQRRHALVHGDGTADARYIARVAWESVEGWIKKPPVGGHLHVDDDYVAHAIDLFEVAGLLLCQGAWKKLEPTDMHRLEHLQSWMYSAMFSGRWWVTEHAAEFALREKAATESLRLVAQFNRWLALKRQGKWDEVKAEVEEFDSSAKHPRFALCRASLLGDADRFFEILPNAHLTPRELQVWPILDEMRQDPRYPAQSATEERAEQILSEIYPDDTEIAGAKPSEAEAQ
jgi:hypothetical protein